MQLQLNSFIKKGTVMNEYVQVLIKLLVRFRLFPLLSSC
jgi:hypothetical protein